MKYIVLFIITMFLASCSSTKKLPDDEVYHTRKVENPSKYDWESFQENAASYSEGNVTTDNSIDNSYDTNYNFVNDYYDGTSYSDRIKRFSDDDQTNFGYYDDYYGSGWGINLNFGYNTGYWNGYWNGYYGYPYYGYNPYCYPYGYYPYYYPYYPYSYDTPYDNYSYYGPRTNNNGGTIPHNNTRENVSNNWKEYKLYKDTRTHISKPKVQPHITTKNEKYDYYKKPVKSYNIGTNYKVVTPAKTTKSNYRISSTTHYRIPVNRTHSTITHSNMRTPATSTRTVNHSTGRIKR